MLIITPTPIGNLEDITLRALRTMQECDTIICEDTRHTQKLLNHYEIKKPLISFHAKSSQKSIDSMLQKIRDGQTLAMVSDAGTPGISDPAWMLIKQMHKEKLPYTTLPGATALVPAILLSGFPSDRFYFAGFFPSKKGRETLAKHFAIHLSDHTIVLYESPYRIHKTLEIFAKYYEQSHSFALVREISKIHEETVRMPLSDLQEHIQKHPPKGELVLCIAPRDFAI